MDEWLIAHGLDAYLAAFRAHDITRAELAALDDADLRELGLTIGARKRFRAALAEDPPVRPKATAGERRPVTAVFVDLVGSSSLSERIDPEELLEVLRRYRAFCAAEIERFGGFIAGFAGDGILAYFCYPVAHENDPERAVRASLAITAGVGALQTPAGERLHVRIGMATGLVVVSDVTGRMVEKSSIIGSTPNLASRLQSLAGPDGIVLSSGTYSRVMNRFDCVPLPPAELRGFAGMHAPWRVVGERTSSARAPPRPPRLTALHGRVEEIALLEDAWARAQAGAGSAVLVVAGPGFGKSRLIESVVEAQIRPEAALLHFAASPLDQDTPLHPFRTDLRVLAGLNEDDPPDVASAKLEAALAGSVEQRRRALPVLAGLLGLRVDDPAVAAMKPERLREQTIASIAGQVAALAEQAPACVVIEDLHWLDPTSLEVVAQLIEQARSRTLLVLMTAREEFVPPWPADGVQTLRLAPLPDEAVHAILAEMFAARSASARMMRGLAARTGGVPLFAEEMARELLQRDALPDTDMLDDAVVPSSLHESLVAHLDRAGPAKQVAQLAAVIGMTVRTDVLSEAAARPDVNQLVVALIEQGVLRPAPDEQLTFAHALMHDAAYGSLVRETRTALHGRVAATLERLQPEIGEREPEVLAFHLGASGDADRAADLWIAAATRALERAALTEASRMLRRGLSLLEGRAPESDRVERRLRIMALLGPVLIGIKGSKATDTQMLYEQGVELASLLPASPSHFPVAWGWWRVSPDFHAHLERSASLLARARRAGNAEQMLQAHHCCWASHYHGGDFGRSAEHLRAGLDIYHGGDFRHHARLYGNHDAKSCAHGEFARLLWMQGHLRQSAEHERLSLEWARGLNHVGSLVHALDSAMFVRVYRRDFAAVRALADELIAFTSEHGIADHAASGHILCGWVAAIDGDAAAGLRRLDEGLARHRAVATYEDFPVYACVLAEALIRNGDPEQAAAVLARERAEFERIGIEVWRSEVIRMQAESALALGEAEQAYAFLAEAEEVALGQGTPMLLLRSAVTFAALPDSVRDPATAISRLHRAIDAIPEPDGSDDLARAYVALNQLGMDNELGASAA